MPRGSSRIALLLALLTAACDLTSVDSRTMRGPVPEGSRAASSDRAAPGEDAAMAREGGMRGALRPLPIGEPSVPLNHLTGLPTGPEGTGVPRPSAPSDRADRTFDIARTSMYGAD